MNGRPRVWRWWMEYYSRAGGEERGKEAGDTPARPGAGERAGHTAGLSGDRPGEDSHGNADTEKRSPRRETLLGAGGRETEATRRNGGGESGGAHAFNAEEAAVLRGGEAEAARLGYTLYRLIDRLAEISVRRRNFHQYNRYDPELLIVRRYRGWPLQRCRVGVDREEIIVIFDTSGSMMHWAKTLTRLARVALKRRDVELYTAPNGTVSYRVKCLKEDPGCLEPVDHYAFMRETRGRTIIYVGDFDGADTPIELSQRNNVVWYCNEKRYQRFTQHSWVSYSEGDFKGLFFRVFDMHDLLKAMRKTLAFSRRFHDKPIPETET